MSTEMAQEFAHEVLAHRRTKDAMKEIAKQCDSALDDLRSCEQEWQRIEGAYNPREWVNSATQSLNIIKALSKC